MQTEAQVVMMMMQHTNCVHGVSWKNNLFFFVSQFTQMKINLHEIFATIPTDT